MVQALNGSMRKPRATMPVLEYAQHLGSPTLYVWVRSERAASELLPT